MYVNTINLVFAWTDEIHRSFIAAASQLLHKFYNVNISKPFYTYTENKEYYKLTIHH